MTVNHIGGDGTGTVVVDQTREMKLAQTALRTHIQSSLWIDGIVFFPPTCYSEQQTVVNKKMYGVTHWYTRGDTKLHVSGESHCSVGSQKRGKFYLTTFTVLSDGHFTFYDDNYNSDTGIKIYTDMFHMEGKAKGSISKSSDIIGEVFEQEKQSILDGSGLGYESSTGPGSGCTNGCGTGGSHGGKGGECIHCRSRRYCSNGIYGSDIIPSLAGSGGGKCSHNNGGGGGSAVRLTHILSLIEGQLTFNGASSVGAGGGAGGSVWIDSEVVAGWGSLHVNGGSSGSHGCCGFNCYNDYHHGGGGGGGRIRSYGRDYNSKVLLHKRYTTGGTGYVSGKEGSKFSSRSNSCSGHGVWNSTNESCQCHYGYVGEDCQFFCSDNITCNDHGSCTSYGLCQCQAGYMGRFCEATCDSNETCSGKGQCSTCGTCVCDACHSGQNCSLECSGFGTCVAGQCVCDSCHLGRQCETECNNHGTCDPLSRSCACEAPWNGEKCTTRGCPGKAYACNNNGVCNTATGQCYCEIGWRGIIYLKYLMYLKKKLLLA